MQKREEIPARIGDAGPSPDLPSSSNFDSMALLKPGQVIGGRYCIVSLLGSGGMGCVYRVEDKTDGHEYALKTLSSAQVSAVAWLRLQKEAKAAQLLNHPTIVKVHEFGLIEDRQPFFVMDLFDGETLAQIIKDSGAISVDRALDIFIEVCLGLGYAHEQGVIHRDIKSSNIMVMQPEQHQSQSPTQTKIVDFGIAKVLTTQEGESLNLTRTGEVFGTPFYMSPEQCLGVALDSRSDIYSLGCVMFESLTGLPPFMGETALSTMMKHQTEKPPTLKEGSLGKEFPDALEKVVARMLEKDPRMRYSKLFDVAVDLKAIKGGQHSGRHLASWFGHTERDDEGKPDYIRLAVIVGVALATLGGTFALGRLTAPSPVAQAAPPKVEHTNQLVLDTILTMVSPSDVQIAKGDFAARIFHFPKTASVGLISGSSPATKIYRYVDDKWQLQTKPCSAMGEVMVENFSPLNLQVNMECVGQLGMLNHFHDGELRSLEFTVVCHRQQLDRIATRSDVIEVDFRNCDSLNDQAIDWLNDRIPNLEDLDVMQTRIDLDGVMSLNRLRQLKSLAVKNLSEVTPLLMALKNSTSMRKLQLRLDNVTDSDMTLVTTMKNLTELDLAGNGRVTGRSLNKLSALHNLRELNLDDVSARPEQIAAALKGIPLEKLVINVKDWSPQQKLVLQKALPHCAFFKPAHIQDVIKEVGQDIVNDL
jgi:Protein kinase domain